MSITLCETGPKRYSLLEALDTAVKNFAENFIKDHPFSGEVRFVGLLFDGERGIFPVMRETFGSEGSFLLHGKDWGETLRCDIGEGYQYLRVENLDQEYPSGYYQGDIPDFNNPSKVRLETVDGVVKIRTKTGLKERGVILFPSGEHFVMPSVLLFKAGLVTFGNHDAIFQGLQKAVEER